jgi:hypothetical protein
MTEPLVTGSDRLEPDDGVKFNNPVITVDDNFQVGVEWPNQAKPRYVQMSVELFDEWVGMMNAVRRLNDLLLNVLALEHRQHADGSPGRVPMEMSNEIDRLKELLNIP